MKPTKLSAWRDIWQKRGNLGNIDKPTLQDLISINGFNSKFGYIQESSWLQYTNYVKKKLGLSARSSVLEVGCGCGAFLLPFLDDGVSVFGIDYAEKLVAIARSTIPSGSFQFAEANAIPYNDSIFDAVVSNGVFYYFPDYHYADQSLREMLRVLRPGGTAAVLDVSDLKLKVIAEELRMKELGADEYNRLYVVPGLTHLYYEREWFKEIGRSCGVDVVIEDQQINGYLNSSYRFNVYLIKS